MSKLTDTEEALRKLSAAVRRVNRHLLRPEDAREAKDAFDCLSAALAEADDVLGASE